MYRALLVFLLSSLTLRALAENAYERVDQRVACLVSEFPDGSQAIGSGFFVAQGVLATARHQVEGARRIQVHMPAGGTVQGRVLALDKSRDAALIRVAVPGPGPLSLSGGKPALGEAVFTVGCPLGLSHTLTRGVVSQPDRFLRGQHLIQSDLATNQGNSGGPLVNMRGEVIGVMHGRLTESNGINFAVPAETVATLMAEAGLAANGDAARLARLWSEAGAAQDAEIRAQRYRDILVLAPWAVEAYYNLGLVRLEQGRLDEAREHFETASLKRTPYPEALNNLSLVLYRQGKHSEARDTLVRAISAAPGFALAYLNLGIVYAEGLRDRESARASFRRFLELAPSSPQAAAVRNWLGNNLHAP